MKLTIKRKLILYSSGVFIMLLLIGILTRSSFARFQQLNDIKSQVHEVLNNTMTLRELQQSFVIEDLTKDSFYETATSSNLQGFAEYAEVTLTILEELRSSRFIKDAGFAQRIDSLSFLVSAYKEKFENLVDAKRTRGYKDFGLIGVLRDNVHNLEDNLPMLWMQVQVLSLRRHEKDYLLRNDIKYKARLDEVVATIEARIFDKLLLDNVRAYQESFHKVVSIDQQIGYSDNDGLRGELNQVVQSIEPMASSLVAEIDEEIIASRERSTGILSTLIVVLLAASVFISVILIKRINRSLKKTTRTVRDVTQGQLYHSLEKEADDEMGDLVQHLGRMVDKLNEALRLVKQSNRRIQIRASELREAALDLSSSSSDQASSLEEISASMEQMVAMIETNTDYAARSFEIITESFQSLEESKRMASQNFEAMKLITSKISLINEISRQTNLLALNAAVEAARAGDHGRGFAVVASEIRKLAERSNVAATEINAASTKGIDTAQENKNILESTYQKMRESSTMIGDIKDASVEQNNGVAQINNAVQNLNSVVQKNAAMSEQFVENIADLFEKSQEMVRKVSFFKTSDDLQEADEFYNREFAPKQQLRKEKLAS